MSMSVNKGNYQEIPSVREDDALVQTSHANAPDESLNYKTRYRLCWAVGILLIFAIGFGQGFYLSSSLNSSGYIREAMERNDLKNFDIVMHISDTHVDPYFDPTMSMKKGICHSCNFSSKAYGENVWCPNPKTLVPDKSYADALNDEEAAFGRYGCNPPYRLWQSLHNQMSKIDKHPKVIVFTGDISPHGYPDDGYKVNADSTVDELCETKFIITKHMIEDLVEAFPNTRWAYTLGNNDHFPKDKYWQPYITKYGDMLRDTGFFTDEQHEQFLEYGSNYIDVDGVRYLSLDMTLFMHHGEVNFKSKADGVRAKVIDWTDTVLQDAQSKGLTVYLVGHQPLATNKGTEEYDMSSKEFQILKDLMSKYSDAIGVGLFGHRNLAGMYEVLSDAFLPLFPALTAPGISPRSKNQPSFHVLYKDKTDGTILDFEQWYFNLMDENHIALNKPHDYLGSWQRHNGKLFSWRSLSGQKEFTTNTLQQFLHTVSHDQTTFSEIEYWKRGGYIGDETPKSFKCKSLYDSQEPVLTCLFKNQDPKCWDKGWFS